MQFGLRTERLQQSEMCLLSREPVASLLLSLFQGTPSIRLSSPLYLHIQNTHFSYVCVCVCVSVCLCVGVSECLSLCVYMHVHVYAYANYTMCTNRQTHTHKHSHTKVDLPLSLNHRPRTLTLNRASWYRCAAECQGRSPARMIKVWVWGLKFKVRSLGFRV